MNKLCQKERKARLLIVDDVASNIKILGASVKDDFLVKVSKNGLQALEIANSYPQPELILLDIVMPGIDGIEVCRRLKASDKTKDIPVILVSAKTDPETEELGFSMGVLDFIHKPFSIPVVKARLKMHWALIEQRKELQEMALKLEELNQTKNKFLGTAAHDLRNPIVSIRGIIEMVKDGFMGEVNEEQNDMLQVVYNASVHMARLVDDLLDVAVIESGHFEMRRTMGDLETIITQHLKQLRYISDKKKMRIKTNFDDIPEFLFDKVRMLQAFDNIFGNAVKYSPPESTITISLVRGVNHVELSVSDEGQGLSDEDQQNLFGAFHKLGSTPTGGETSTGLGLSIVKKIIDAHDGKVLVNSELNKGTKMSFILPMHVHSVKKKIEETLLV